MANEAVNKRNFQDGRLRIEVDEDLDHGVLTFRLEGRLDVFTYLSLKERMAAHYSGPFHRTWLVDLSKVTFVASSGWSVFIGTHAHLKTMGCTLGLVGLAPVVLRIYQSMGLGDLVPVFGTLADALRQIGLQTPDPLAVT